MRLGELIATLEQEDLAKRLRLGFSNPHSYRGFYDQLAFERCPGTTVGEMLVCAREAKGASYSGWKGGEFQITEDTECWLASEGCTGEMLGSLLLYYMLKETGIDLAAPVPGDTQQR